MSVKYILKLATLAFMFLYPPFIKLYDWYKDYKEGRG